MMFFRRQMKDKEVSKQIVEYCNLVYETLLEFQRMIAEYIEWDKHFKRQTKKVHNLEHQCDVLRKNIERAMYEGAFLPAYREDYITLLEKLDKVANLSEDAADTLFLLRPDIPEEIRAVFNEVAELTVKAFEPVPEAIANLLDGHTDMQKLSEFVEEIEQQIDKLQFHLIRKIFKELVMDKADALILKLLVDRVCDVSDKIENVGDYMCIIAIKRRM